MNVFQEKARLELQAMRDSGMTDKQIRTHMDHQLVYSQIGYESEGGRKSITLKKLGKDHVSRKWLRGQLLAVPGNTPRFVDGLLDRIHSIDDGADCYWRYWYRHRHAILAA